MQTLARVLNIWLRVCGAVALTLGLSFWLGYARAYLLVHIGFGLALVVSLWVLAVISWKRAPGLAAFAGVWGLATVFLGMTQPTLLPGSMHWIVQVVHLAMGMGSIGLGARLTAAWLSAPVRA